MMSSLIKFVRALESEIRELASAWDDGTANGDVVSDVLVVIADAIAAAAKKTLLT